MFTSTRHLSLSWARSIQSMPPHPTSWRFVLISSAYLRLDFPSGLFSSVFPTKTLYTPLSSPHPYALHATTISFFSILSPIRTVLGEEYRSLGSSLCSFLHSSVNSSLLGPNSLLNTLFSPTLNVSDKVSLPHKTTGKIIVLYILIFKSLKWKTENSAPNGSKHFLTSICS